MGKEDKKEVDEPLPWWIWVLVGIWAVSVLLFAIDYVVPLGVEWPHYILALAGKTVQHVDPEVLKKAAEEAAGSAGGDL